MLRDTSYCWVKDVRERRYLTFDMENPRHRKAFELFTAQPNKLRSEFVVSCILAVQEGNRLEKMIHKVISEALKDVVLSAHTPERDMDLQRTEDVSKLPDVLIASLDKI